MKEINKSNKRTQTAWFWPNGMLGARVRKGGELTDQSRSQIAEFLGAWPQCLRPKDFPRDTVKMQILYY